MLSRRALLVLPLTAYPLRGQRPGKLRITRFETHRVTVRWRDLLFLEVHTSEGLTGLGEATLEGHTEEVEAALQWLEPGYIGLDPAGPEDHWNRSYYRASRWRNGPAGMSALSAVDIALWDLEGKRLGVPVTRLLGGPIRRQARVYYTHWGATLESRRTPEAFAEWATETLDAGWTAVKWTLEANGSEAVRTAKSLAEIEAVRKAVGSKLDICLEAAETFTVRSAIQFARAVAPLNPLFLEEPTLRENPAGLGEVAARSPVPIATGEGLFSRFEFRTLLDAHGAAIIQPDVLHAGGITEIRKIANLAETYGVEVAPHQCSGPIGHVASLAAMSVCRNFVLQEWEAADDAVFHELTEGTYPQQKNGFVSLPDQPGLGITVNFAEFKKRFPYRGIRRGALVK